MVIISILMASSATKRWINLTPSLCHITWGGSTVVLWFFSPAATTVAPSLQQ